MFNYKLQSNVINYVIELHVINYYPTLQWWSCSSEAVRARCPKKLYRSGLTQPDTGEQALMLRTVSLVVCLMYGIRKISCRHQVSKASKRFAGVLVTIHVSHPYCRTGSI